MREFGPDRRMAAWFCKAVGLNCNGSRDIADISRRGRATPNKTLTFSWNWAAG